MADPNSMKKGAKKMAFTFYDSQGQKIELEIDDEADPEKIADIIAAVTSKLQINQSTNSTEFPATISSQNKSQSDQNWVNAEETPDINRLSKIEILKLLIRSVSQLDNYWFSAKDILQVYKDYIDPDIPHSTISTYLARLHKDGLLKRKGNRRDLEYCLNPEQKQEIPHYLLDVFIKTR